MKFEWEIKHWNRIADFFELGNTFLEFWVELVEFLLQLMVIIFFRIDHVLIASSAFSFQSHVRLKEKIHLFVLSVISLSGSILFWHSDVTTCFPLCRLLVDAISRKPARWDNAKSAFIQRIYIVSLESSLH